jgi:alkanesulfonate monooxygenase SsuD/methylene tetrahydromethanopterin reductase-like flavin-dependent oxidoreductase (luciferase family)
MSVISTLRINMTGEGKDAAEESRRYQQALEMAAYADANGFDVVGLEEHHCASNGWLPSPLVMAGMVIARTQKVQVNITALLITLYDPVRLAEDIAVLDLASGGRLNFIAGLGYRPIEYHALDKSWDERGANMDATLDTLIKAWTGEPFEYKGKTVQVTPVPLSRPHPPMFIGGMSKAAARRAARFGLPLFPPMHMPELEAYYYEQLKKEGKRGGVLSFAADLDQANSMLFIDPDPDATWEELAPCFLRELQEYASWKVDGVKRPLEQDVHSIEDLREQKRFEIITPEQCLARFREHPDYSAVLHPLAGGVPVERAWDCLKLYTEEVLKPLRAD